MSEIKLNPSFIEKEGKREYAVLPYDEYEKLQEFLEDAMDLYALREAKAEDDGESVSLADVKKQLNL